MTGPRTTGERKNIGANGHATGYLMLRLRQEDLTKDFCSVVSRDVAATMKNTPKITATASGKKSAKKKKRKGSKNTDADDSRKKLFVTMDRMERKSGLEDKLHSIHTQQQQLSTEEASLLTHKEKLSEFITKCLPYKRQVRNEEITPEDEDEWEVYEVLKNNVETTKAAVQQISDRINRLKSELEIAKKEYEVEKTAFECAEKEEGKEEAADEEEDVYDLVDSDNDDIFSLQSNNGSVQLDHSAVPPVETII